MEGIQIQDFETENLLARYKFRLTDWTLDKYASLSDVLMSQKQCVQLKYL